MDQVGTGKQTFERAKAFVKEWKHFDLGWASVHCRDLAPGKPVCVVAKLIFLWTALPLQVT